MEKCLPLLFVLTVLQSGSLLETKREKKLTKSPTRETMVKLKNKKQRRKYTNKEKQSVVSRFV